MDLAAVVFAGEAMRAFMEKADDEDQDPKPCKVADALLGEVEEHRRVRRDHVPVMNYHDRFRGEEQNNSEQGPAAVDEAARCSIEPVEVSIRVPCRKADVRDVEFSLCSSFALGQQLLAHGKVLILVALVPERRILHPVGECAYFLAVHLRTGLTRKFVCDLLVRSLSIEYLEQLPLSWRQPEVSVLATLEHADDGLSVENSFVNDQLGIHARRLGPGRPSSGKLRENRVERLG